MVNKPLIRPYFFGGSFGGGVARIPMNLGSDLPEVTSLIYPVQHQPTSPSKSGLVMETFDSKNGLNLG